MRLARCLTTIALVALSACKVEHVPESQANGLRLDGYRSRDSLVHAFVEDVVAKDTAALRHLALTRVEFDSLYYPDAPLAKPPYELDAETMWTEISARSERGFERTINRYGGTLGYKSYMCERSPQKSGALTLWNACLITHTEKGRTRTEQLFGTIVERDGWFKFVGLSNRL